MLHCTIHYIVIPAKAGIHDIRDKNVREAHEILDPGLHRDSG